VIGSDHGALAAWERIVLMAIDGKADAILLAGDFYDSLPAQYESRRRVKASLEKLKARQIPVLAVAGNHDYDALPDFARSHPDLIHLFPSATWGENEVKGIRIIGRSFAGAYHRDSMLRDFQPPVDGRPTLGLVHADIDGTGNYGPTPLADFTMAGVSAWLVGHVHMGGSFSDGKVVYPGSPQALDWGECGPHGVRWLEIGENGRATFDEICPISTVRYEHVSIALTQQDSLDEKLRGLSETAAKESDQLSSLQFRVDLRLDPGDNRSFPDRADIDDDWYEICSKSIVPRMNLEDEAKQSDARGQAARLLLGLDGKGDMAWREKAICLVDQLCQNMTRERSGLRLPPIESLEVLRLTTTDDARRAVRRMLERILTAEGGVL
jgi:DNA repair exonuclease SbcCD nuclease subunit